MVRMIAARRDRRLLFRIGRQRLGKVQKFSYISVLSKLIATVDLYVSCKKITIPQFRHTIWERKFLLTKKMNTGI